MKSLKLTLSLLTILFLVGISNTQDHGVSTVRDIDNILSVRKQMEIMEGWLKWRLDNILPDLMRREGFCI